MCIQRQVLCACGCKENLDMIYCDNRIQNKVKCTRVTKICDGSTRKYCTKHQAGLTEPASDDDRRKKGNAA